jgi:iron complex transport system substrate-binding protein
MPDSAVVAARRIISLAPSTTEILYALGAGNRVVGVTRDCDWPPEARAKALDVGGWLDVHDRRIHDLQPDLIVTSTLLRHDITTFLEANGLPVLSVDPKTMDDVMASIVVIGRTVGAEVMAQVVVEDVRRRMAAIAAANSRRMQRPRVYVEEWHQPPTAAGLWIPQLVTWAGGVSGLATMGQRSPQVSDADVQAYDPELIVLAWSGFGTGARPEQVAARPGWQSITGLRTGQVHVIDDRLLNRPGPRLLLGLRQLTSLIQACA